MADTACRLLAERAANLILPLTPTVIDALCVPAMFLACWELPMTGGGAWLDDARRADRPVVLPLCHDSSARVVPQQPAARLLPLTPLHAGEGNECVVVTRH